MKLTHLGVLALTFGLLTFAPSCGQPAPNWSWDDELDAVAAAPESHRVLLEDDEVRVLEVVIQPGEREPAHTHRWRSIMISLESARIRYYDAQGQLRFETPADRDLSGSSPDTNWMGPEGLHSVENIDDKPLRALRVEFKTEAAE